MNKYKEFISAFTKHIEDQSSRCRKLDPESEYQDGIRLGELHAYFDVLKALKAIEMDLINIENGNTNSNVPYTEEEIRQEVEKYRIEFEEFCKKE